MAKSSRRPLVCEAFISLTVTNSGDAASGRSPITIHLNDTALISLNLGDLAPGESNEIRDFKVDPLNPGRYLIEAVADGADEVTESRETNNRRNLNFRTGGPYLTDIPQFGAITGLTSDIVVTSGSISEVQGTVLFFDPDGELLDSNRLVDGGTDFQLAGLASTTFHVPADRDVTGSVLVSSDQPVSAVVRFDIRGSGIAGVGSSAGNTRVVVPVRKAGSLNTGIAIRNMGAGDVRVHAFLYQGRDQMSTAVLDIPHNGRLSQFVSQLFPALGGLTTAGTQADFVGVVHLVAERCCFGAIALELDVGRAFTTLPVGTTVSGRATGSVFSLPVPGGLRFSPVECNQGGSCRPMVRVETTAGELDPSHGLNLKLEDDDSTRVSFPAGFPYFGETYDHVFVNTDGNISFGQAAGATGARDPLTHIFGPPRISPFFRDLDPTNAGQILADVREDRLVVTWNGVPAWAQSADKANTFQVTLHSNGTIEFAYREIGYDFTRGGVVIGIAPGFGDGGFRTVEWSTGLPAEFLWQTIYQFYDRLP